MDKQIINQKMLLNNEAIALLNKTNFFFASMFLVVTFLLAANSYLDIEFSRMFYDVDTQKFIYADNIIVKILFYTIPKVSIIYGLYILIVGLAHLIFWKNFAQFSLYFTIFISINLSGAFIINTCLKEFIGRARPRQITEFGGNKFFSPAMAMSNQCNSNCSFSSGHAAGAFIFTTAAFLFAIRKAFIIYYFGIIFGLVAGLSRIAQGAHFLSDITMSGFVILIVQYYIIFLYQKIYSI
ncbi:MAG: phosphatase PAP2 family protein [Rickettsiaceae bacterium]|nr:phosphatase PAP2 family protein [Rickettsiaceae bacterium]